MSRLKQVQDFIESDLSENLIIEPKIRYEAIKEGLLDVINSYNPEIIIKAGIGYGDILLEIANKTKSYITVVEPSFTAIVNFVHSHEKANNVQNIRFINGDFHDFPVDYYACDLLICIDYLDFFDSGKSVNEFKRALKFDGIFFFSTVVLDNNDTEGIYDDFMRLIFPLHNDYYLADDITTFLELKEFSLIKNMQMKFKSNLKSKIDHFRRIFDSNAGEKANLFIESHKEEFAKLMNLNESLDISESYYLGVYMREKPDTV